MGYYFYVSVAFKWKSLICFHYFSSADRPKAIDSHYQGAAFLVQIFIFLFYTRNSQRACPSHSLK